MTMMDKIQLAVQVVSRWETLVTLAVFIAFWLLVAYVADPWRADVARPQPVARKSARKKAKTAPAEAADAAESSGDADDDLTT